MQRACWAWSETNSNFIRHYNFLLKYTLVKDFYKLFVSFSSALEQGACYFKLQTQIIWEILLYERRDYICKKIIVSVEFIYNTSFRLKNESDFIVWIKEIAKSESVVERKVLLENRGKRPQVLSWINNSLKTLQNERRRIQIEVEKGEKEKTSELRALDLSSNLLMDEGVVAVADMLMVKPGLFYLDILQRIKETFAMPTFAFQVSGEYAMLKVAGQQGLVDGEQTLREALLAFKRAGANGILTYAALETAKKLAN